MKKLIRPKPPNLIYEFNARLEINKILSRAFCFVLRNLLLLDERAFFASFFTATRKRITRRYRRVLLNIEYIVTFGENPLDKSCLKKKSLPNMRGQTDSTTQCSL